ncbi:MAG: D-alanyl-D-alanine carboxypeptidase/D-alanyl-D-alanine-endopeptidase [Phycisphaerales bacterium]|nr:MAG: D-alanyl-D-alanine carboxypeptidase/D-alanyl-D-alanine-endopeptidase [Phycisphaerales bacterium]
MKSKIKNLLILTATSLCLCGSGRADLAERIDGIVNSQKGVRFSIRVVKADSRNTVYEHSAKQPMVPASNMKIVTSAAALKFLGPDYEFRTKVGLSADSLVVIGAGDPLLGDERIDAKYGREKGWIFEDIAGALGRVGVQTIKDIIIDTSIFDNQRVHPSWPKEDLNRWWACEVGGLNFNDNCIDVTVKNVDGTVAISIEPQTSFVKIINEVAVISKGISTVGAYRNRQPNKITVRGKCKNQAGPFDVAIEEPAAFFGFMLAENLLYAEIDIEGRLFEKVFADHDDFQLLAEYRTSIADCLQRCNKNSLGLVAEALMKTIDAENRPERKGGSWSGAQEIVTQYLVDLGISEGEFNIDDGSGLSEQNKLSANAVTTVLLSIYHDENWVLYRDSLAVGGEDGTIAKYFQEKKYKGNIRGKTGYIAGVKSFSGICSTSEGDYIFSILANNANGSTRTAINEIAEAIIDSANPDG